MTTRQSQIFWFLVLYALSAAIFLVMALLTRLVFRGTWER